MTIDFERMRGTCRRTVAHCQCVADGVVNGPRTEFDRKLQIKEPDGEIQAIVVQYAKTRRDDRELPARHPLRRIPVISQESL